MAEELLYFFYLNTGNSFLMLTMVTILFEHPEFIELEILSMK